jgi:hypothetical protein
LDQHHRADIANSETVSKRTFINRFASRCAISDADHQQWLPQRIRSSRLQQHRLQNLLVEAGAKRRQALVKKFS